MQAIIRLLNTNNADSFKSDFFLFVIGSSLATVLPTDAVRLERFKEEGRLFFHSTVVDIIICSNVFGGSTTPE